MKLFNKGKEEAGTVVVPVAAGEAPKGVVPVAAEPAQPDLSEVLDASVKEMAEKIARLTSSLENANSERQTFEEKVGRMEDRMRKLSSLTEAISAQYNPFVGDAPPSEGRLPRPPAPGAAKAAELSASPAAPTTPASIAIPAPSLPAPAKVSAPAAAPRPEALLVEVDANAFHAHEEEPEHAPAERRPRLSHVEPSFESSLLMLNWADSLLRHAGSRDGLEELLAYYQNIGWITGEIAKQVIAHANGLPEPALMGHGAPAPDWHGNVAVHERTLLYIEKLRRGG